MMDSDNGILFTAIIQTIDEINTARKHYRIIKQLESASTSVVMSNN